MTPAAQLATVGDLIGRGLSIIPVKPRDKRPAVASWRAYQDHVATSDELAGWFGNGQECNIAIVTGAVSGVVVVDCDDDDAIAWADSHLPSTEMRTRTGGGGEHRFYRHPGVLVRNKVKIQTGAARLALDIRGEGGYVVAPGSVHASGAVYERVGSWPAVETLPVFDPAWIAPDPPRPITERDHAPARAVAYLAATPGAVEGQGGDAHTFQVCCRLVRGFDLADADAWDLLVPWNARCVPPWSEDALRAKLASARTHGTEPFGGRLREARAPAAGETPTRTADQFGTTDTGNAEYFARLYGNDLRFDHRRGRWLVWRAHRWQPDPDGAVRRLAKAAVRHRFQTAADVPDADARARLVKWSLCSESRGHLEALAYLAQSEPPIADAGDEWDAHPMLLGVPNGVIDLHTGTRRDGRRDDRITMCAGVPFDPTATCPRWERFVSEVFGHEAALVEYVRRAVGYSITGLTGEQVFFIDWGAGANGKGTFQNTIADALGDYAFTMPFATVELNQRSAIPNDLAALVGRRFVIASETNDGSRLNEARLKALTGCDPITARFLHNEFFTFRPVGKFWLSVNHKPLVRDDSHGFWRRVRLIPFTQTFAVNPQLADDLRAEAPGILAWAVRGCLAWQADGLTTPAVVTEATHAYEQDSDPIGDFLAEATDADSAAEVRATELYDHYKRWADGHGLTDRERLTATMFGRRLQGRVRRSKTRAGAVYHGIARAEL